jgi:hypothetical protein
MIGKFWLVLPVSLILLCQTTAAQNLSMAEQFRQFCSEQRLAYMNNSDYTPEINEKDNFIEIKKNNLTIQFSGYTRNDGTPMYVFSSYKDTCCGSPEITAACYIRENNAWKNITADAVPALTYNDFFGRDVAAPSQYQQAVQFRYVLHTNNQMEVVVEPRGQFDEKFLRIFEARRYAAVQMKWNRNANKFEIRKWLK